MERWEGAPLVVPAAFGSPREGEELVRACEASFDRRLSEAAAAISRDCVARGVRIIRLSGPTCSGKTTTARKLTETLEAMDRRVYPISLDDFFYDRRALLELSADRPDKRLDYDSVRTMDLDALSACIRDLHTKGRASVPVFDFLAGRRTSFRTLAPKDGNPVFLFEGIQAVYPEVEDLLDDVPNRSLFISVFRPVTVVGPDGRETVFATDRIRLMRRLVRDEARRGARPAFTLSLWRTVRENELRSILPYAGSCDYLIDSAMAFEIHMLAPRLRRLLADFPPDDPEAPVAAEILASLQGMEDLPSDLLPANSLYREFILN